MQHTEFKNSITGRNFVKEGMPIAIASVIAIATVIALICIKY